MLVKRIIQLGWVRRWSVFVSFQKKNCSLDFLSLLYHDKREMEKLQSMDVASVCRYLGHHPLGGVRGRTLTIILVLLQRRFNPTYASLSSV